MKINGLTAAAIAVAAMAVAPAAHAADFYAGKTLTVVCPYPPGGTYDRMARLVAQYLPKHIPGSPTAIASIQVRSPCGPFSRRRATIPAITPSHAAT